MAGLPDRPAGHAVPALLGPRRRQRRHRCRSTSGRATSRWRPPVHRRGSAPAAGATDEQIVLLLRGQLLRRYPDMVVYAVQGTHAEPGHGGRAAGPADVLRAAASRTSTSSASPLTPPQLAADEWWFVLEQQLTAPRFGFDIERRCRPASTSTRRRRSAPAPGTADRVAVALLQRPIRVALHRDRLLLAGSASSMSPPADPSPEERRRRARPRAADAAAGAPGDPLHRAARRADRAARPRLPRPDPRRRATSRR